MPKKKKNDTNAPCSDQYMGAFLSVFRVVAFEMRFFKHGNEPIEKAASILESCVTVSI
jgi:hypothetical protein